jgi:hypothetical protein
MDGCEALLSNTRCTFRKSVWLEVAALTTASANGPPPICGREIFDALNCANWNIVQVSHHVNSSKCASPRTTATDSPVCIVMLHVDMDEGLRLKWSNVFIEKTIRAGVMYGVVGGNTHIIVQLFFKRVVCNTTAHDVTDPDETVSVVLVDKSGMAYCYNLPSGEYESLALRFVSNLLKLTVGVNVSMMFKTVPYENRSYSDSCLYALYITAFAMKTTVENTDSKPDIANCRPSVQCARPTRIIANLRFLMFLCSPQAHTIELLLDELNRLDAFREMLNLAPNTCLSRHVTNSNTIKRDWIQLEPPQRQPATTGTE